MQHEERKIIVATFIMGRFLAGCGTIVRPGQIGLKWNPLPSGLEKEPVKEGFHFHMP